MGEACGTYGRLYRCIQVFGGGDLREREGFEDLGVDGRIILKCSSRIGMGAWVRWIWLRIGTDAG